MLKQNGRGVVRGCLVIAFAVTATVSAAVAQAITSPTLFAVNSAIVSALGQEAWTSPPKDADSNHDYSDPNGDDPCPPPPPMPATGGGGLHVTYATGNVWTKVPILSASGNGQETLDLELVYNSIMYNEDTGLGKGWRLGYDFSCQIFPSECTAVEPPNCPDPCNNYVCIPTAPAQVRFRDGNGRRTVRYYQILQCDSSSALCQGYFPTFSSTAYPALGREMTPHILQSGEGEAGEFCRVDFPDGRKWYYKGNGFQGKISRMVSARELTTRFAYDTSNRLQTVTDGFGRVITFLWDVNGRLTEIIHPDDTTSDPVRTTLSYTAIDAQTTVLSSITDTESNVTSFDYEPTGPYYRLNQETLKNGVTFNCQYTSNVRTLTAEKNGSQPVQILRVEGNEPFPVIQGAAIQEQATIAVTDEQGMIWHYGCDDRGRLSRKRLQDAPSGPTYGATAEYVQFIHGDPTGDYPYSYERIRSTFSGPDGVGLKTTYTWGPFGTITSKTVDGGPSPYFNYTTTYAYEDTNFPGFVTRKTLPNNGVWEYTYNAQGDLTQILDPIREQPNDQFESYLYTYFGNTESPPPGLTESLGRLKTITYTNRNGFQTIWTYNGVGNLASKQVQTKTSPLTFITTTYEHDAMGRQTLESVDRGDGTFSVTKSTYDKMGRMTTEIKNFGESDPNDPPLDPEVFNLVTQYRYDGHGLVDRITNPRGVVTEYEYDHLNREKKMTEDPGVEPDHLNLVTLTQWNVTLQWHTGANTLRMADAEGRATEYVLDGEKRPIEILDAEGYRTRYQRDILGNVESTWRQRMQTDTLGGQESSTHIQKALYDDLGRMLSSTIGEDPSTIYSYDWSDGGGGCSCGGQGGATPRKIEYNPDPFTTPSITINSVDLMGRTTQVLRKGGLMPNPQGGNEVADDRPIADEDDSLTVIEYDAEGNAASVTGPEGETALMSYDGANRLTNRTVAAYPFLPLTTTYDYDGMDNVRTTTEPTGHVVEHEYDGADRLQRTFDDLGDIAVYLRDANGNLRGKTDGNGNTWSYFYDAADRLKEIHDPIVESPDGIISYMYDRTGNLLQKENRNRGSSGVGVKTRYFYDGLNRLTKSLEDYNEEAYTASQQLLDGGGESGVQGGGTLQGGGTYNPGGGGGLSQTAVSTPTINTETHYKYDGRFLIEIRDHHDSPDSEENGNKTTYEYNRAGRVVLVQYPDTLGNCESPNDCNGAVSGRKLEFYYSLLSNQIERVDQRGVVTRYIFDEFGRLSERSNFNGGIPVRKDMYGYDRSHRLSVAAAYDATETLQHQWQRTYDKAGRPLEESQSYFGTNAQDFLITNAYVLNTSTQTIAQEICYPDCGTRIVERVWDKRGRIASANAGTDIGVNWTYDPGDRRIGAARRNSTLNYSQYVYDENDRMTGLHHFANLGGVDPSAIVSLGYSYDAEGNRIITDDFLATNRSEAYGVDNRHPLTWMNRGEITTNEEGKRVIEDEDWLAHEKLAGRQEWTDLDHRGNWKTYMEVLNGAPAREETRKANGVNAYFEIKPESGIGMMIPKTLSYDAAGNLTFNRWAKNVGNPCARTPLDAECTSSGNCDTAKVGCNLGQEYKYDSENRVIVIYRDTNDAEGPPNGSSAEPKLMEFSYDALGRRVETIEYVDAATGAVIDGTGTNAAPRRTRHVYAGLELIQEYSCDGPGSVACGNGPQLVREFVHGDPARYPEVVAMIDHVGMGRTDVPPTGGFVYHYLHDVLGSVIGLVDETGLLRERYTYDPYGRVFIEHWGEDPETGGAWLDNATANTAWGAPSGGVAYSRFGNPFLWTGHRYDAAVGLYATLYRTYSPTLGRWLERDPIEYDGGSLNLYEYVLGNPMFELDPLGLMGSSTSPSGCAGLLQEIEGLANSIKQSISNQPESDPGGKTLSRKKDPTGSYRTKPQGHTPKLIGKVNRLRRLLKRYDKNCTDDPPPSENAREVSLCKPEAKPQEAKPQPEINTDTQPSDNAFWVNVGIGTVGSGLIIFDLLTFPSGEGIPGYFMVRRALAGA